jgi:hypothetical protein
LFEACAGELGLLSHEMAKGREVRPDSGNQIWGGSEGWELPWPGRVGSETNPLDDTFIVIVTDTMFDLSCLDMQHLNAKYHSARGKGDSDFMSTLRHFGFGYDKRLARTSKVPTGPRYNIYHIHVKFQKRVRTVSRLKMLCKKDLKQHEFDISPILNAQ